MRTIAIAATTAALVLLSTGSGHAQTTWPWCATYNDAYGARNCGFATFQQCLATVSGIGGFCGQNPMFRPDLADPRARRKVRRG